MDWECGGRLAEFGVNTKKGKILQKQHAHAFPYVFLGNNTETLEGKKHASKARFKHKS